MKITFVLNDIIVSGGVKAVFCISNCLVDRGHDVKVIYPLVPMGITPAKIITKAWYRGIPVLKQIISSSKSDPWFNLKAELRQVPYLSKRYMPDADVVVATWWETAYFVNNLPASKGRKFYFIQHYEIWGGPKNKVDASYRLGLINIVNSQWTKERVEGVAGKVAAKILHAPDWRQFADTVDSTGHDDIRVLMQYRKDPWKCIEDGVKAFELARQQYPQAKLVMFGRESDGSLPDYVEFNLNPIGEQLNRLYRSCDIFLFTSKAEGFGMPPMEAMACKVPVVTTNVGAVSDYAINGKTALISKPENPAELAKNLCLLIESKEMRDQISDAAYEYIKDFTWERATQELAHVFADSLR